MHVHSTFSSDGKSSMNEHCEIAKQKKLKSICFTEHVDLNDKEINLGKMINKSSQLFNVDEYFNEIDNMKKRYIWLMYQAHQYEFRLCMLAGRLYHAE